MFPIIPEMGLDCEKDIEGRLKNLQKIDSKIRYQIRLGDNDYKVFIKFYIKGEYESFRELPIEFLDPNNHVRPFRNTTVDSTEEEPKEQPDEPSHGTNVWKDVLSKKTRKNFIKEKKRLNRYVTDLQIIKFLHAYVKGTKISPWNHFLSKSPEDTMMELVDNGTAVAGPSSLQNLL